MTETAVASPQRVVAFQYGTFPITGSEPLIIRRPPMRVCGVVRTQAEKDRERRKSTAQLFQEARYLSDDGWEGLLAGAVRHVMISTLEKIMKDRMTLALGRLGLFVLADGHDIGDLRLPLIRIDGPPPSMFAERIRLGSGRRFQVVSAVYHDWKMSIRARWDSEYFGEEDIANLLIRMGATEGLGEFRPGCNKSGPYGTFELIQ